MRSRRAGCLDMPQGPLPPAARRIGITETALREAEATGRIGREPVGVQLLAGRCRKDLLLKAGVAIEAAGVPPAPVDPA